MRVMLFLIFVAFMQTTVFAQGFEKITKAKLEEDIFYMVRTIEKVHINPYHSISKERFYQIRDSIIHSFPDSVSVVDSWRALAFLIASLDEGHSDLKFPKEFSDALNDGKILLFPITVSKLSDDGLLVRNDYSGDSLLSRGEVLLSINDIPATEIRKRLLSTTGGLPAWRELRAVQDFTARLYLHGIRPPYKINYHKNGKIATTIIEGLPKDSLLANAARLRKSGTTVNNEPYRFTRINYNIGYLDFRTMSSAYEPFAKFLEDTFAAIKQKPINGLIIDLRRNGGGNSMLGYKLLTYITDKPFTMAGGSKWKVSDEYRESKKNDLISAAEKDRHIRKYLSMKDGEILTSEDKAQKPEKNSLRYEGKVCVLIGPNTFSSANMTANAIQDYNLATLIGEPTGEAPNDYGELYEGRLPNTKIQFITSTKMYIRANGDAADKNPVLPHIIVKQNLASGKDDVLEFAINWINSK